MVGRGGEITARACRRPDCQRKTALSYTNTQQRQWLGLSAGRGAALHHPPQQQEPTRWILSLVAQEPQHRPSLQRYFNLECNMIMDG